MRAFHSCWSAPATAQGFSFAPAPFEVLTAALSALVWRALNGEIVLYADAPAQAFYADFAYLWDEIRPFSVPDCIDPSHFWAMGKLIALQDMGAPCVMLDTDFIVWERLSYLQGHPLATIHREAIDAEIYPDPHTLRQDGTFALDDLPLDALPANTAVAWFGDADFMQRYVDTALQFCRAAQPDNRLTYMVFVEQRLLAMLAQKEGVPLQSLTDGDDIANGQRRFSHVWGYKQILQSDENAAQAYCQRCAKRLQSDFPEYAQRLREHLLVREFFES